MACTGIERIRIRLYQSIVLICHIVSHRVIQKEISFRDRPQVPLACSVGVQDLCDA
jgi:hypothetical protein